MYSSCEVEIITIETLSGDFLQWAIQTVSYVSCLAIKFFVVVSFEILMWDVKEIGYIVGILSYSLCRVNWLHL